MKQIILLPAFLIFFSNLVSAQCSPSDTIANQAFPGNYSVCGTVPCENIILSDGDTKTFYTSADCRKIATVTDSLDGTSLSNMVVCETIDCSTQFYLGQPFLNRHFEMTPLTNGKAIVCLYILNQDILDYNLSAFPTWPALNPYSNLGITQVDGGSITTPGSIALAIPNSSINASYDSILKVWTLCFPVDSFSNFYIYNEALLGINDVDQSLSSIYPNPSSSSIYIQTHFESGTLANVDIIDMSGRKLSSIKKMISSNQSLGPLQIESLPKGVYTIRIESERGEISSTFFCKE